MAIVERNLPAGININNQTVTSEVKLIEDLQNTVVDFNLLSNNAFSVTDGAIMRFIAPIPISVRHGLKSAETETCGIDYKCIGASDFEVPLKYWQGEGYAFDTCAINMLSSDAIKSAFYSYVKSWQLNRLQFMLDLMEANYAPTSVTGTDIINVTEDMVAQLEAKGFDRSEIIVLYNTKANSLYRKKNYACCELRLNPTANNAEKANPWDVQAVYNVKQHMTNVDIIVYVKKYVLVGNYCERSPEIFMGVEKFRGKTLIEGREGYGGDIYKPADSGFTFKFA